MAWTVRAICGAISAEGEIDGRGVGDVVGIYVGTAADVYV